MNNPILKSIEENIEKTILQKCKRYNLQIVNPVLLKSLQEYTLRKGKRIRPVLFIASYQGYSPGSKAIEKSIYHVSTAIEFLHNFMLIHDDIIDNSHLRRGKPTMHKLLEKTIRADKPEELGKNLAIITGDIIYALAIESFLEVKEDPLRKEAALKYFLETTTITAMGELIDTLQGVSPLNEVKESDAFLNYSLKTARYTFNSPLVIGAILAGASKKEIIKLSRLSLEIGQAFQIQDDIIGVFDSEKRIGKSILSDFGESKKTLLVCHCYQNLSSKEKKTFSALFTKKGKTLKDLYHVRDIFINSGSLEYCIKTVATKFNSSLKLIQKLQIKTSSKQLITDLFISLFLHTERIATENKISIELYKPSSL